MSFYYNTLTMSFSNFNNSNSSSSVSTSDNCLINKHYANMNKITYSCNDNDYYDYIDDINIDNNFELYKLL